MINLKALRRGLKQSNPVRAQIFCGALALTSALAANTVGALEIVVPAYFYPGPLWTQLNAAAGQVPLTAIMNPSNGPGGSPDANYVGAVNALRAAGGRVIGYVYSGYGARPLAEVTADIDKFATWYDIDGIFVDEMANTGPAERLNYYKSIYDHVKTIDPQWEVMGNPGTTTIEAYLTWPGADRLMVFEGFGTSYPGHVPSSWNAKYDSSAFVNLIHTEPSATTMLADLNLAVTRGAGAVYVTNDQLNNPWDTLPSYWAAEVSRVAQINATFASADFNEDGSVDGDDLARWNANFGLETDANRKTGDADGDGAVDGHDLLAWQRQAGTNTLVAATSGPATASVPEPATAVLALGVVVLSVWRRRYAEPS